MRQMSSSSPDGGNNIRRPWLEDKVYKDRHRRTVDLVVRSVDALRRRKARISLATVAEQSKQIDKTGKGVSRSAIINNDEAHAYFSRYSTYGRRRPKRVRIPDDEYVALTGVMPVKRDRDIPRARQRYMRLTKPDLVQRLISIEQAYAEGEERWLLVNDDVLTWQLRAEEAERRLANGK